VLKTYFLLFICLFFLMCGQKQKPQAQSTPQLEVPAQFTIQSSAFKDIAKIPDKFTGVKENISPQLNWTNPPAGTQSFALIVDDPDAPRGTFTHWIIYDIPANVTSLPEGVAKSEILPDSSRQLANGANKIGYTGPMPPPGKVHHYHFKLYALDKKLGKITQPIEKEMEGHVLGQALLIGTYER
jgi:Raf kinase inhibitor-like YbhB/YbcL family protein